jgi:hypothetical protein
MQRVQRTESKGGELAGTGLDTGVQRHIDPGTDPEGRREPAVLPGLASFSTRWAGERMRVISPASARSTMAATAIASSRTRG